MTTNKWIDSFLAAIQTRVFVSGLFLIVLGLPVSGWAGDLEVDNLTVSESAAFYGPVNVLSSITTNYGSTGPIDGLVAWWKFDETNGATAIDSSGNANTGVCVNVTWMAGKISNSVHLAGNGYVKVPYSSSLNPTSQISYSVWIKPTNLVSQQNTVILRVESGANRKQVAFQSYGTQLTLGLNTGGSYWETDFPVAPEYFTDGQWHHLAFTYDGTAAKMYIDGTLSNSVAHSGSIMNSGDELCIGSYCHWSEFFKGGMDDLRIYNRTLTANDVLAIYNLTPTVSGANGSISVPAFTVVDGIIQSSSSGTNVLMGKVGIGTNNPAEQLHVVGNVRVDGTHIASAITLGGETRTTWPSGGGAGGLMASNNLSDVADPVSARDHLGLGSAATYDASAFDPTGTADAVNTNLSAHTANFNNPHQVTASQTGALTPSGNGSQLTGITAEQVGALTPTGDGSQLAGITAGQVGALSTNGGVVNGGVDFNGLVSFAAPFGDVPMGVFTNR